MLFFARLIQNLSIVAIFVLLFFITWQDKICENSTNSEVCVANHLSVLSTKISDFSDEASRLAVKNIAVFASFIATHLSDLADLNKKSDLKKHNFAIKKFQSEEVSDEDEKIADKIRLIQQKWSNTPYVLGKSSLEGADCTGFTQKVFADEFNLQIPRTTVEQMKIGKQVSKVKAGDLLYFYTGAYPNGLHVGIYVGNNKFVHLSSSKGGARYGYINKSYWKTKFIGARRFLEN